MVNAVNSEVALFEQNQLEVVTPEIVSDIVQEKSVLLSNLLSKWLSTMEVHSHALDALTLELPKTAQNIDDVNDKISQQFANIGDAIKQQNTNIQQISELIDHFNVGNEQVTIKEFGDLFSSILGDSITQILFVSKRAVSMVYMLDEAMSNIAAIETFVGDINSITKKDNLLALNASIEAVNAGGASKGFSIVADEMKQVSENISALAKSINQRIGNVNQSVKDGYGVLHDVATTDLTKTVEAQSKLTALMNGMIEQKNKLSNAFKVSEDNSKKIAGEIASVNSSLQSQKNSTQYIGSSVRVLNYISQSIATLKAENNIQMSEII